MAAGTDGIRHGRRRFVTGYHHRPDRPRRCAIRRRAGQQRRRFPAAGPPERRPGVRRLIRPNAALPARVQLWPGWLTDFRRLAYRRSQAEEHRGHSNLRLLGGIRRGELAHYAPLCRPHGSERDRTWAIDRRGGGGCLISSKSQIGTLLSLSGAPGVRAGCPAWGDVVAGISSRVVRPRLGYPRVASASD